MSTLSTVFLDGEARALRTRLERVRPFVINETMVSAAALTPAAMSGIERLLLEGRRALRGQINDFLDWLHGPGTVASPAEAQRPSQRYDGQVPRPRTAETPRNGRANLTNSATAGAEASLHSSHSIAAKSAVRPGRPAGVARGPPKETSRSVRSQKRQRRRPVERVASASSRRRRTLMR